MEALFQFFGLSRAFGDRALYRGLDLCIPRGSCSFIVGPSGAGKSVLMKMALGFIPPDAGSITYLGQELTGQTEEQWAQLRKRAVYVFQHPSLMDSVTALENIELVLGQHGVKEAQAAATAAEVLARLGVSELADKLPRQLSNGEQKLVSIARAAALAPETLILDEPTTGLDPLAAGRVDELVGAMLSQREGLIVISHDLRSVRRLASNVIMLSGGALRFQGPTEAFFNSEEDEVRAFVEGRPLDARQAGE